MQDWFSNKKKGRRTESESLKKTHALQVRSSLGHYYIYEQILPSKIMISQLDMLSHNQNREINDHMRGETSYSLQPWSMVIPNGIDPMLENPK